MADLSTVHDPERLAALRRLVLLDTASSETFERLTRLAARTLAAPISLLTLIDDDRQFFLAAFGLPEPLATSRQTSLEYSLCQYAVASGRPLVVCDARVEHWLDDNPAVTRLGVTAYAGVPLVTPDGYAVGTLCVLDFSQRSWTDDDLLSLADLAAVTMHEMRLHRLVRRAAHRRDGRG